MIMNSIISSGLKVMPTYWQTYSANNASTNTQKRNKTMDNHESKNIQWFALDAGAGLVYALGDCEDFEAAEQVAEGLRIEAVWIADADTARQWMRCIQERFGEIEE